ncbi:DMT family transporter [Kaustia mangrovi]|uniref:DMT family transporter n=1 Tax=Kaustia mangrovi TaxID=2593653 RepID=A0A7S8C501_9HYPH|nr:DMT family transporter [Kaustia mangrovi]QPC43446.1 DMT family transporter [Kaustia mangrovi]
MVAGRESARSRLVQGILAIVGAVFLLSLSDSIVKLTSDRLPVAQLLLVRSVLAAIAILAIARLWRTRIPLRLERPGAVGLRSLCLTIMWVCYYAALPTMPFALAAAALYTAPMWMAILFRGLLGEPVGWRRWGAIAIGLAGVGLVLRPDAAGLAPVSLLPFAAAFCYALAAVVTWSRCGGESPLAMALNLNLGLAGAGALGVLWPAVSGLGLGGPGAGSAAWMPLDAGSWALLGLLAVFMVAIATAVARAYQLAPAPVVGMFDNAYLVFAALWSALLIGDLPDFRGLAGMVLIGLAAMLSALPGRQAPAA